MMRKTNFFLIALVVLLILYIPGCIKPYAIQFEKKEYDFGVVEEGVNVDYTYIFKNTGTEPIIIRYIQPSCVCTRILQWDRTIAPGKKGKISITLDTPRYNGELLKLIDVKTNIPEQPSIRLILKGKVIIPVELVPLNAWLGEVNAETEFLKGSVKIVNNLDSPLKITEVIPPDNKIQYTLITIEENQLYKLDYILYPPFEGEKKVEKKFTFKTNNKKNEYVYHKFFYFIPLAIRPATQSMLLTNLVNKSETLDYIK